MFTITTANNKGSEYAEWEVHATGCQHVTKRQVHVVGQVGATTTDGAVAEWIDEEMQDMGWDESHVRVMPCAK